MMVWQTRKGTLRVSNQPETGIFKTNDSMSESHRSDHVTLLSIGDDVSDTQFKTDNQDTK